MDVVDTIWHGLIKPKMRFLETTNESALLM